MSKQKIEIEVWVPHGDEIESCKHVGDVCYMNGRGLATIEVIVRPKWQWPTWLKARWIAMDETGHWFAYQVSPVPLVKFWKSDGGYIDISSGYFDFTPPPCDDWRTSLRENPNWSGDDQTND